MRSSERHSGVDQIARAAGVVAIKKCPLNGDKAVNLVHGRDHSRAVVQPLAAAEWRSSMKAQSGRQDRDTPATKIDFRRRAAQLARRVPDMQGTLPTP
jgi:hypothetical protein